MEVPLYIPEDEVSPGAFLKKATAFGMGGWWIGGTHMKPNPGFMREVVAKVPKDSKIILGCQKGLRSLLCIMHTGLVAEHICLMLFVIRESYWNDVIHCDLQEQVTRSQRV